ncbi:alpha/beta fold hydrolase [Denitrobaculum tricleocarpae]|uniref:Alpha/beta hydrolase n=1 Tax=Denitrobaculum tricleocarpae TaxID=2591009 RepID=A0A545U0U8_9PROT|nr:hypothetical protein [Denitrobaculum tricleocarpae]TQV83033.1 hypothetical protein FKG95_00040 [Denitrobaculum tricleocarpae]
MLNPVSELPGCAPSETVTLLYRPAKGKGALSCWLALPSNMPADATPIVAVHGIRRGAKQQAEALAPRAAALGRPVIAPLFDKVNWPKYQQVVRGQRADLALLELMTELRLTGTWRTRNFELCGYSGGAQFAHRFAMLYPQLVTRLTVSSAGWYTFLDDAAFPYGLNERPGKTNDWGPRFAAGLDQFLRIPVQVCIGEEDCVSDDNTRQGPEIDAQQGRDRLTRARRWSAAFCKAASERGLTPRITLSVMPGCGHDFQDCVQYGGLDRLILPDGVATALEQSSLYSQQQEDGEAVKQI